MGTAVEISVASTTESTARTAIRAAFEEIERIDRLMSWRNPESLVAGINREGATRPVPIGPELFSLLSYADEVSRNSGGAFDITIGPVSSLWNFNDGGMVPESEKLEESAALVGHENIIFDKNTESVGFRIKGAQIDLGAIAKGHAVDRAAAILKSRGVGSAIVDAGGDLRLVGERPGGGSWRIGIQHPRDAGALIAKLDLADTAVVTSGDYERYFEAGGVRYHHILDPSSGQPARGCRSVTVIAATAAEADACSTAAFVLGPERGIAFLRSRPGVRGLIVGADGALHWSDPELEREAIR